MIEVTQKNHKGNVQIIEMFDTEEEFGKAYRYNRASDILNMFATEHIAIGSHEEYTADDNTFVRCVTDFTKVAYNEKGKALDPTHVLGLVRRQYHRSRYWYQPGTKDRWHRGTSYKQIHTTPERRAVFACEDQEEYTPKVRCKRNLSNLPNTWDDYWRFTEKNWKKFRKHQWKD